MVEAIRYGPTGPPPSNPTPPNLEYPTVRHAPNKDYLGIDDFVVAVNDDKSSRSNPVWVAVEVGTSTDPDLIANYHCDEGAGVTTTDTGGNVGTLHNGVTWTAGKSKSGLAFAWKAGGPVPVPGFVKLENAPATAVIWLPFRVTHG